MVRKGQVSRSILGVTALATLLVGGGRAAGEGLAVRLEPLYVDAVGHDQPVLEVQGGSAAGTYEAATDSGLGYHLEVRKARSDGWGWGVDFLWFTGSQTVGDLDVAGAPGEVVFDIADRQLVSAGAAEPLYYRLLEDNDINVWALDLYGLKTLSERAGRTVTLQAGLRTADFDNDYRAALGVGSIGGVRLDSSSNYDRMHGPLVGLIATYDRGRTGVELAASQSVVFGTVQLSGMQSDFDGFFAGESQEFTSVVVFTREQNVTIPITEVSARWRWGFGAGSAVVAGVTASSWWNVSVPPGVIAAAGREAEDENTITLLGVLLGVEF